MSPPVRTFWFDHFTVENQIDARIKKYGGSKADKLLRVPIGTMRYQKRA